MTNPIKLAIIGCGSIVHSRRIGAAAELPEIELAAFIDQDFERAAKLAAEHPGSIAGRTIDDLPSDIDAAHIALPNNLHADCAVELAERGLHLIVEKPLAITVDDCDRIIAAANANSRVLLTALDRRYRPQFGLTADVLRSGELGAVSKVEIFEAAGVQSEGMPEFYLDKQVAGGGVLMDIGIHIIDLLLWWFGKPTTVQYVDDAGGGLEAECRLELGFEAGPDTVVTLSRINKIGSTAIFHGERQRLEVSPFAANIRLFDPDGGPRPREIRRAADIKPGPAGAIAIYRDFVKAMATGKTPHADGRGSRDAMAVIEEAYRRRRPLHHPWASTDGLKPIAEIVGTAEPGKSPLAGKRVLVTGGSGFIGSRVVEKLCFDHDCTVRVLTRSFGRATRVARLGVEIIQGAISDRDIVAEAVQSMDIVLHCARPDGDAEQRWQDTLAGTQNLIDAARREAISRFVNVSSMVVYGAPNIAVIDERAPIDPEDGIYSRAKAKQDQMFADAFENDGFPVVTLQPTVVYGPFGGHGTQGQLAALLQGPRAFPSDVAGKCNAVFVDDVADAIILAAISDRGLGEAFLISADETISWREYLAGFENILQRDSVVLLPEAEIERIRAERGRTPSLWNRLMQRFRPPAQDEDLTLPSEGQMAGYRYKPAVSIAKARDLLGYRPQFDFERGMALTGAWARYSRLTIPPLRRKRAKAKR